VETSASKALPLNTALDAKASAIGRLVFVDHIRVYLTILVILHHLMVIYAGTGNWIYMDGKQDVVVNALGGWFCATNQAYFMGLFLLISAYFVPGSYDRKGGRRFLKDRLIRLGIPLAIYSWIINPLFVWAYLFRNTMSPWQFFGTEYFSGGQFIGQGPLWFVETLLIFSLVYAGWRFLSRPRAVGATPDVPFPGNRSIAIFIVILTLASFLVRLKFVMDIDSFALLNLQLPFFPQYIALFIVGLVAFRRNWLSGLPDKTGLLWLRIAGLLVLLWAPMMLLNGAIDGSTLYRGGLNWQSLVHVLWESALAVAACIGLIYGFRRFLSRKTRLTAFMIPNAYTAYLIHGPIITGLALAVQEIAVYPLLKWAAVALIAIPVCFGLSALVRKLPFADRVL
jgi:glucans biosynthesis protein C